MGDFDFPQGGETQKMSDFDFPQGGETQKLDDFDFPSREKRRKRGILTFSLGRNAEIE